MTGAHPPAWYEDPSDPTRVRRWNGRAWTGDVRPRPPWLRTVRLSTGPSSAGRGPVAPASSARRLWWVSGTAFALALIILGATHHSTASHPDRLARSGFAVAADRECLATRRDLKSIDPKLADATLLERRLRLVEPMVDRMRRIRPSDEDSARVERWLSKWDLLIAEVHVQLDAYEVGDDARAKLQFEATKDTKAKIDRFSTVNGMLDCVL